MTDTTTKAGAEQAEPEAEDFEETEAEDVIVTSNAWDGHMASCTLVNAELERVHRVIHEFEAETPIRKSQTTMLNKLQTRVLELTAVE